MLLPANLPDFKKQKVGEDLAAPCRQARIQWKQMVVDAACTSSEALVALMRRRGRTMLLTDSTFFVELALVDALCGPKGCELRVKQVLLNLMPTKEVQREPHLVLAALSAWMAKDAYKYAATAAKSKVEALKKWLGRLVDDRAPDHSLASADDMLSEVADRFQYFLVSQHAPPAPKKGIIRLTGADVLRHLFETGKSMADKAEDCAAVAVKVRVFHYLETDEVLKKQMNEFVKLVETAAGDQPKAKKAKKGGAASSSSMPKDTEESKENDKAMAKAMSYFT